MIKWYIKKFKSNEMIFKTDLQKILLKTKENESKRCKKICNEKLQNLENRKNIERISEVEELKVLNIRLQNQIDNDNKKNKQVHDIYFTLAKEAKKHNGNIDEFKLIITQLKDVVSSIYGITQGSSEKTKSLLERLEDQKKFNLEDIL